MTMSIKPGILRRRGAPVGPGFESYKVPTPLYMCSMRLASTRMLWRIKEAFSRVVPTTLTRTSTLTTSALNHTRPEGLELPRL